MQDFLKMYANIVEKCFTTCCNDFTSKALSSKEVRPQNPPEELNLTHTLRKDACVANCTEKWLKHSERVGARFAEFNAGEYHYGYLATLDQRNHRTGEPVNPKVQPSARPPPYYPPNLSACRDIMRAYRLLALHPTPLPWRAFEILP